MYAQIKEEPLAYPGLQLNYSIRCRRRGRRHCKQEHGPRTKRAQGQPPPTQPHGGAKSHCSRFRVSVRGAGRVIAHVTVAVRNPDRCPARALLPHCRRTSHETVASASANLRLGAEAARATDPASAVTPASWKRKGVVVRFRPGVASVEMRRVGCGPAVQARRRRGSGRRWGVQPRR